MTKRTIYAISLLLCTMGLLLFVSCGLMSVKNDEQKKSEEQMPQKEITVTTEPSKTMKAEENEKTKIYEDDSEYLKKKPKTNRGFYVYVIKTDPAFKTLIVNRRDDNASFSISNAKLKGYKRFDQIKEGDKVFLKFKNGTPIVTKITRQIKDKIAATEKPKIKVKKEIKPAAEKKPTVTEIPANHDGNLEQGRIMHNVPREMKVGINERIEVKISKDFVENLTRGLKGKGIPQIKNIKAGECMKVRLSGTDNFFQITSKSSEEQKVNKTGFTIWEWDVIPLHRGLPNLNIKAIVVYETKHGAVNYDIKVFDETIPVKINVIYTAKEFIQNNWGKIIPIIISSGIIGWALKRFRIFRKINRQRRNP